MMPPLHTWKKGDTLNHLDLNLNFSTIADGIDAVVATGSTTPRALSDRASDVANIRDFGGGIGGDDAAAIRRAVATGKKYILIPPGNYVMKSALTTWGTATDPSCVELRGLSGVTIFAYGATFLIDNSISGPTPVTTFSFTNNAKDCALLGGTLVGNTTGTSGENVGINIVSVSNLTLRDVKLTGTFVAGVTGAYVFDSLLDNVRMYNVALGFDIAHIQNLEMRRCLLTAGSNPVSGINLHYDVPTLGDNSVTTEAGAARTLAGGLSNKLRVLDCEFVGFGNGIAIDCIQGALISRTVIRNGLVASSANAQVGVLVYRGSSAITAGLATTDVTIEDCEIYGNGVTAGGGTGGGVYVGASSGTIANVAVVRSRIYDNTNAGVTSATPTTVAGLVVRDNDFRSRSGGGLQTAAIGSGLAPLLTASPSTWGTARDNSGGPAPGVDYLMVEGPNQSGVADADGKLSVLRLTSNQGTAGVGGSVEFGGVRPSGGAQASGYFAALKGALTSGTGNTLGTLDVYVRAAGADTALTYVGGFTATGLNGMAIGVTTPAAASVTQLNLTTSAGPNVRSGAGAASGTQPKGSLWMRTDGGVGTTIYVSQGAGTWNPVAGV